MKEGAEVMMEGGDEVASPRSDSLSFLTHLRLLAMLVFNSYFMAGLV